jgi:hypothetical protein
MNPYWLAGRDAFSSAQAGPHLWRIRFGSSLIDAHLHHLGHWGVAYNLFLNGHFTYGHRFATADEAIEAASARRRHYEADGWIAESVPEHNVA